MDRPMPRLEPVTSTTLPLMSKDGDSAAVVEIVDDDGVPVWHSEALAAVLV